MSSSVADFQLASAAAGFTLGFGFLTIWEAMKQTRRSRNPRRSVYIYMVWGEIVANLVIGIIGWLFLNGVVSNSLEVLFFILVCWVFEIQLLMQIIINRIAIIAENRKTVRKLKWGTAAIITAINITVFCIWIPSHLSPPVSQLFVDINTYWDKVTKFLILFVDAGLNYYFLRIVQIRLVKQHGLKKYAPLVGFNAKLMVVSIAMDILLIGLMWLPNQLVYIQFHPVVYMVKLNIEMAMANLITVLARGEGTDGALRDLYAGGGALASSGTRSQAVAAQPTYNKHNRFGDIDSEESYYSHAMKAIEPARQWSVSTGHPNGKKDATHDDAGPGGDGGIHRRTDVQVQVHSQPNPGVGPRRRNTDDEIPLTSVAGQPGRAKTPSHSSVEQ